jgi:hypothetical protein
MGHWTDVHVQAGELWSVADNPEGNLQYSEDEDDNLVLGPFELLCGLEKTKIEGWVTKVYSTQLSELLQSNTPVIDLPAMFDALGAWPNKFPHRWSFHLQTGDQLWGDKLSDANDAALTVNAHDFYLCRRQVIKLFRAYYDRDGPELYAEDSDLIRPRFNASSDDTQEFLEQRLHQATEEPETRGDILADLDKRIAELQVAREKAVAMST